LASQVHAAVGFALLLGCLLPRTPASAGPCCIRAAGGRANREYAGGAAGEREQGGDRKRDRPYRSHQGGCPAIHVRWRMREILPHRMTARMTATNYVTSPSTGANATGRPGAPGEGRIPACRYRPGRAGSGGGAAGTRDTP